MNRVRLEAPSADRSLLCVPEFSSWAAGVERNRARFAESSATVGGTPLPEVREQLRRDVLARSGSYLASFGAKLADGDASRPLIATGHQPELFHPGVWIKSLAASRLAERVGGWSLQFLADADAIKHTAVRVPSGTVEKPVVAHAAFDVWTREAPYEERLVADEGVFRGFADRVEDAMRRMPFRPIVQEYWSAVMAQAPSTPNLGERLAAGRRSLEAEFGWRNWEAPLSRLCEARGFFQLAAEFIGDAGPFRKCYNAVLSEYRARRAVRSKNHPAPDLRIDGARVESPFWVWRSGDSSRRPLWVEPRSDRTVVWGGGDPLGAVPAGTAPRVDDLRAAFQGWKLRPRAMVATLFLRLLAADWFIHGVGGAKYDEATDALIRLRFGVEPPEFGVATATLLLPGASARPREEAARSIRRRRRDVYWNPERHLDDSLRERDPIARWIEEKLELQRAAPASRADRKRRFEGLRAVNERLRPYASSQIQSADAELAAAAERDRARAAYASREFAFCLHPRSSLQWLVESLR